MPNIAYKILTNEELESLLKNGSFEGSALDRNDGYIHMSTPDQARATAAKYFAGRDDLVLVVVDLDVVADAVRWEPSRGGELFPHLYSPLRRNAVLSHAPLVRDASGKHVFPALAQ